MDEITTGVYADLRGVEELTVDVFIQAQAELKMWLGTLENPVAFVTGLQLAGMEDRFKHMLMRSSGTIDAEVYIAGFKIIVKNEG